MFIGCIWCVKNFIGKYWGLMEQMNFCSKPANLENWFAYALTSSSNLAITLSSDVEIMCRRWRLKLDIPSFNLVYNARSDSLWASRTKCFKFAVLLLCSSGMKCSGSNLMPKFEPDGCRIWKWFLLWYFNSMNVFSNGVSHARFRAIMTELWLKQVDCSVLENPNVWTGLEPNLGVNLLVDVFDIKHLPKILWVYLRPLFHKWTMVG